MILDTNLVLKQVLNMRENIQDSEVMTKDQYKEKYSYLADNSPTLFDLVYKDETNYLSYLEYMLKNTNKVGRNELSQYDADVEIGKTLANDYIYPNIDMDKEQ